jgi:hypothetical protein
MPDDFCLEHGYEFMRCDRVWGAIPYCLACDVLQADKAPPEASFNNVEDMLTWLDEDEATGAGQSPRD